MRAPAERTPDGRGAISHDRATRILTGLFATAVCVSIVHYADNYFNYSDYPLSDTLPNPSAALVGASWFLFTGVGVAGYLLFRRGRYAIACMCLGFYSGSGLVGLGHYAAGGLTDEVWWRQAHVDADILLGVAMLAFALFFALRPPRESEAGAPSPAAQA